MQEPFDGALGDLRTATIRDKVALALGEYGKEVVNIVGAYAINPAHMKFLIEGLGLRFPASIDGQLESLRQFIHRNGKRDFINRAQYELGERLRQWVLSGESESSAPERRALIDTFTYRGPDRRTAARERRHSEERRHEFKRVGEKNQRFGRDRRQTGAGRRSTDK